MVFNIKPYLAVSWGNLKSVSQHTGYLKGKKEGYYQFIIYSFMEMIKLFVPSNFTRNISERRKGIADWEMIQ